MHNTILKRKASKIKTIWIIQSPNQTSFSFNFPQRKSTEPSKFQRILKYPLPPWKQKLSLMSIPTAEISPPGHTKIRVQPQIHTKADFKGKIQSIDCFIEGNDLANCLQKQWKNKKCSALKNNLSKIYLPPKRETHIANPSVLTPEQNETRKPVAVAFLHHLIHHN